MKIVHEKVKRRVVAVRWDDCVYLVNLRGDVELLDGLLLCSTGFLSLEEIVEDHERAVPIYSDEKFSLEF